MSTSSRLHYNQKLCALFRKIESKQNTKNIPQNPTKSHMIHVPTKSYTNLHKLKENCNNVGTKTIVFGKIMQNYANDLKFMQMVQNLCQMHKTSETV